MVIQNPGDLPLYERLFAAADRAAMEATNVVPV
jgi:hypothetical protein